MRVYGASIVNGIPPNLLISTITSHFPHIQAWVPQYMLSSIWLAGTSVICALQNILSQLWLAVESRKPLLSITVSYGLRVSYSVSYYLKNISLNRWSVFVIISSWEVALSGTTWQSRRAGRCVNHPGRPTPGTAIRPEKRVWASHAGAPYRDP